MQAHRDNRPAPSADASGGERGARRSGSRRFRRRLIRGPQTVEAYLKADSPPRYMRRLLEIDAEFRAHLRRLEASYRAVAEAAGDDAEAFALRWRARAHAWRFDDLNELVREHNEWYPVEADLPMDPRTCDYVPVHGRSYRRLELGAEWVLEHFPPRLGGLDRSALPRRAPREA